MSEGEVENLRSPAGGAGVWRRALVIAAVALSLGVAACASIDAPPAPANVEPAAAESPPVAPPSPERKRLMQAFGGEYHAAAIESDLNGVLLKLAPASNASAQPYRVTVLNSPVVNAFALPSGDIFVTRGLLALADDTSEIAAVMAHEIAHVTARHAAQRAEFEKTAALFTRVNAQVLQHAEADDEVQARSKLSIASFSRQQEFEADRIGIKDLGGAGYDPYGAARFLTALGEWSALTASISGAGSADRPDMMATHPSTPERVAQAEAEARQIGPPNAGAIGRDA
jgi:predicted Zn-dependent protease